MERPFRPFSYAAPGKTGRIAYVKLMKSGQSVKAANLKAKLLAAYAALGYDRNKKNKDIDKWLQ